MLSDFETMLLGVMMMVIMLGMGASLTFKDFALALRKPAGIGIGLVTTYVLTPLVGVTLATVLQLPPAYAVGLILMACLPGGTTSNTTGSTGTCTLGTLRLSRKGTPATLFTVLGISGTGMVHDATASAPRQALILRP